MNFDDMLEDTWRSEIRQAGEDDLTRRVRQQRRRHVLQRTLEVVLTVLAVPVFGHALMSGRMGPPQWLLLPFFLVYVPLAWVFILRAPRQAGSHVAESTQVYARLRMAQLRTRLRDLWLARVAGWALLAYALTASAVAWVLGDAAWRAAGVSLSGAAMIWIFGTLWVSHRQRRSLLREYRAMRRLASP